MKLNSVERILEYSTLPTEEKRITSIDHQEFSVSDIRFDAREPDSHWPSRGSIEFRDVIMYYRPELPSPALKVNYTTILLRVETLVFQYQLRVYEQGISFKINEKEKVGVIGRTGAGKSSILTALFRLVECSSGCILIDDVDISTISLSSLRRKYTHFSLMCVLYHLYHNLTVLPLLL